MSKRSLGWIFSVLALSTVVYFVISPQQNRHKPAFDTSTSKGLNTYLFARKEQDKYKPKFDKPDLAMQEEIALRSEVNKPFAYPQGWRLEARRQAMQEKLPALYKTGGTLQWVERGPDNFAGRTRSIVVHPSDQDIWWVGAVGGGIWKTEDAGGTWRSVTEDMPVLSVCTIDICKSAANVLYAGTGEGFYNSDAIIGDGLFKSTDYGESWQQLSSTTSNSNFRYVNRIIVDPNNPDILLAATNTGLYRSTDGGASWSEVFNDGNRVQQIIANPDNFNNQFITVNSSGIYRSTDGGLNWSYVSEEISDHNRIEIAISEADTDVLYASPVNSDYGLLGFYKSPDNGVSWYKLNTSTNWLGGQGWYDNTLVVSPLDPDVVYVGGIDLYKLTINGGSVTEDKISHWYSGAGYPYVHADQHFLVTLMSGSNDFSIVAANDGGIHYSPDQGNSWEELNNVYNVTQYYDADKHPSSLEFIGGTQDNGTHRSPLEPDLNSSWSRVIGGDGFDCAWHKTDPNIVFGTLYYSRIYKSTDGGYNYTRMDNGLPESGIFHTPLEMNQFYSDTLYTAGDDNTFYYSFDAAESWNSTYANYGDYSRVKISASRSNPDIVWTGSTTIYNNVSVDGGLNFSQVNQPSGSPHAWLTGISTHPTQDSTAFVTIGSSGSDKIYRSEDLGQTWESINNNLPDVPVFTVLVMPYDINEIWIGTDIGLFISYDAGQTWQYADNDLPAVSIRRLKIVGQEIVAATHGRGIWSVFNENLPEGKLLAPILADITVPNPNTNQLKLRFNAASSYDSVAVFVNSQLSSTMYNIDAGIDTFAVYSTNPPETVTAQLIGYRSGDSKASEEKSRMIYEAVQTTVENFDDLETTFFGDLFAADESGFSTALLNSDHPYEDGRTYIGYLGTPIDIQAGSYISYSDVAIVESGESGSVYPDENFWDYVTVEGSNDGDNWTILIEPYDCRYDPAWEQAYNNNDDGNESMFRNHEIDLTTQYATDEKIHIRFRLFADANTNGWGWGIDDVEVDNLISGLSEKDASLLNRFALIGNYPNPFNPQTQIRFTLSEDGPVSLNIYNNLGQLVTRIIDNKTYRTGTVQQVNWDGRNAAGQPVASGTYYYKLEAGNNVQIKKMVLIR